MGQSFKMYWHPGRDMPLVGISPKPYVCLPSQHSGTDRFSPPPPPPLGSTDTLAQNWHCLSWAGRGQGCPKGVWGHSFTLGGGTLLPPPSMGGTDVLVHNWHCISWAGPGQGPPRMRSPLPPTKGTPYPSPPHWGARPAKYGTIHHMVRSKN